MWRALTCFVLLVLLVVGFSAFTGYWTIFVVPPIEALPEGGTLIVWRSGDALLADSADAACRRQSRLSDDQCRADALREAAQKGIALRLPYSGFVDRYLSGS